MPAEYEKLLSPGTIGSMKLRNRIVMPAMVKSYATPEGYVTRKLIDHYTARAKGGVGLIIVEATYVHASGKGWHQQLGINSDKCIPGLTDLTEAVKGWGAKIAIQLHHAGRETYSAVTGMPIVAPSAIPIPVFGEPPKALTLEEVAGLVEDFAQGARRAKEAGFDAVEIHGAHGYLVNQFLSPNTNQRSDKYGGDLNRRARFALEIISRIRELAGKDFAVMIRLNAEDLVKGGITLDDSKEYARIFQATGIDAINVTAGTYETALNPRLTGTIALMYVPHGHLIQDAEQIKKVVSVPVIAVGSITPEIGEAALREGKVDFIAIGRGLIADPELPNKLMRGMREDIRPCMRCGESCSAKLNTGVRCTVNSEVGFESYEIRPAWKTKKVIIVGGGPAGLEAARVAALRGHSVTIFDKNRELGGHLIEAGVPDFKEDLKNYKDWLVSQVKKLGVKVELGKEVTPELITGMKPDTVIVATGGVPFSPDKDWFDKPNVTTAIDILQGKASPGKETIIAGGGAIGSETALYLAQKGKKVTLVEMLPAVCSDVQVIKGFLTTSLADSGIEIMVNTKITGIDDTGVTAIVNGKDTVHIDGNKVAIAMGLVPKADLYEELEGKIPELYLIGDADGIGRVSKAVHDGYRIGAAI